MKRHRYIGFLIGTIIVCVMGILYLLALYNNEYESMEGILWLTFFIGLPFSWLIFLLDTIGIRVSEEIGVGLLCLLNWSVIGYVLSIFGERWRKL